MKRFFNAGGKIAAITLASAIAGTLAPLGAALASDSAKSPQAAAPTPEVKLVADYNSWFVGVFMDPDKMRAGLPKYITAKTVLREATSLPWGGTMIGYDGWVRLCHASAPIFARLGPLVTGSDVTYYQHGNVVLRELVMTIKPAKAAPEAFNMGLIEKYTVERGRITQIDEFYADTATFLERLRVLGALPEPGK
jgi:hypothetical protein